MTSMSMRGSGDEIAELRNQIEKLTALVDAKPTAKGRGRSWRRPMALTGVAVLTVGMLAGVAGASGTTTNVTFVPLSPAKVILSNVNIGANKTSSAVVIGGTTTVPSNATTVQLTVTAKGASIGTLNFYPTLNPSGGSGQTLAYPGSNVAASTTIQENVGQASSLTFANSGIGTATVTAKITGYSTQVTAGDINGVGGTNGQVLTNDGAGGAAWTTPPVPSATNFSTSGGTDGQVLTNAGTGAVWSTPAAPSASNFSSSGGTNGQVLTNTGTGTGWHTPPGIVGLSSITGPAGVYPAGATAFVLNQFTNVSVHSGETVQASVSAALGSSAAGAFNFEEDVCYVSPSSTTPSEFNPGAYMYVTTVPGAREVYSSSGTFIAGQTGTYKVGLCVKNISASPLDNTDWVNGSVSVFNPGS